MLRKPFFQTKPNLGGIDKMGNSRRLDGKALGPPWARTAATSYSGFDQDVAAGMAHFPHETSDDPLQANRTCSRRSRIEHAPP